MDGRSNNFRRHQPPLTSRPQDQGRFNHQDARPESDQHNRQHARPASASHNQEFAQPTSSYHNRYDDESARNQGEALPRIATWEEYQSGRDQLEELEARAARSKNDPVQSRHWITQFMRLFNYLEEVKQYLPNRHRHRHDPALPTAPIRDAREYELIHKATLLFWDFFTHYKNNNDREQKMYWSESLAHLFFRKKMADYSMPSIASVPPPNPDASISNWTEYDLVKAEAVEMCTAAVLLKKRRAGVSVECLEDARKLNERLEAAERYLPLRNAADSNAADVLMGYSISLSALISDTAATLQQNATSHSVAGHAQQQGGDGGAH